MKDSGPPSAIRHPLSHAVATESRQRMADGGSMAMNEDADDGSSDEDSDCNMQEQSHAISHDVAFGAFFAH